MKFGIVYYHEQDVALLASNWSCGELKQYTLKKWYYLYVESRLWYKRTYLQNRNRLIENRLLAAKREWGRGMDCEFGVGRCKRFIFKMDKQQGPNI